MERTGSTSENRKSSDAVQAKAITTMATSNIGIVSKLLIDCAPNNDGPDNNLVQCKYDSLSKSQCFSNNIDRKHWKDRVYRRQRRLKQYKPYDPVDEINITRLRISPKKAHQPCDTQLRILGLVNHTPIVTENYKDCSQSSTSLLQPAKLCLDRESKPKLSPKKDLDLDQSKAFDFASLAHQVTELDGNSKPETGLGDWKELRKTLSPLKSTNLSTSSPAEIDDDEFDELSTLSNLSLRTDGLSEAGSNHTTHTSPRPGGSTLIRSCSQEAMLNELDFNADELAYYFDELVRMPKQMSMMAEMMYT